MDRFECRDVDASFFQTARERFELQVELACPPERLFEIFEDPESWPRWAPGIGHVEWKSPKPYGPGTTRTVQLRGGPEILEYFFAFERGRSMAFRVVHASLPVWDAFAESYEVVPTGKGSCRLTWTVAYEPRDQFAKLHPYVRPAMWLALKGFMLGLKIYVALGVGEAKVATASV
jgi:hypothetical protein